MNYSKILAGTTISKMFISTIIPTVGRKTLARAVESVTSQSFEADEFEVIIVNDSGTSLDWEQWQTSKRVQIINTNRRERSIARNTGAAIAKGKYLHFLDDDDLLYPDAYQYLFELSQSSAAKWLYGWTQLVDRQLNPTIQLKHNQIGNCFIQAMAGEWIPLQSSLIERNTFMRIGGFNPLLKGPEDIDLLRRILLTEGIAETPNLIAQVIMGGEGSTTNYDQHPLTSRWAREIILDEAASYSRMSESAHNPFWRGRMVRVYLTSVVWNLRQHRIFTAGSRMFLSIASILAAGTGLCSKEFWREITKPYASVTFDKGIREAKNAK